MAELSLETPDGNLAPPIQSPFKKVSISSDQAYICNLCIDPQYRRKGLAKKLINLCECIVKYYWNKDCMYDS